jgi:hypothetical protein
MVGEATGDFGQGIWQENGRKMGRRLNGNGYPLPYLISAPQQLPPSKVSM